MATRHEAEEAVQRAGELYERGVFPFQVYDGMRLGLTGGYYTLVVEAFKRTCGQEAERRRPYLTHLGDQLTALWRDLGPAIRAWVAQGDELTEAQWAREPAETRRTYEAFKALLGETDK